MSITVTKYTSRGSLPSYSGIKFTQGSQSSINYFSNNTRSHILGEIDRILRGQYINLYYIDIDESITDTVMNTLHEMLKDKFDNSMDIIAIDNINTANYNFSSIGFRSINSTSDFLIYLNIPISTFMSIDRVSHARFIVDDLDLLP